MLYGGRILKAKGLHGEIKVLPLTDDPSVFSNLKKVMISGQEYTLEQSRVQGQFVILKLKEVNNIEEVERLAKNIYVFRDEIPLEEGHYFVADLLGATVLVGEENIGKLVDVYKIGRVDTYVVEMNLRKMTFPAIEEVVKKIDIENKVIELDKIELDKVVVYEI